MQAVLQLAIIGDTGSGDLGQAVNIVGTDVQQTFDLPAHVVGPGLGAEQAAPELEGMGIDPHIPDRLADEHGVGWGAAEKIGAEILQNLNLPLGVAGGNRRAVAPMCSAP